MIISSEIFFIFFSNLAYFTHYIFFIKVPPNEWDLNSHNIHVVTGVLKLFFRELPEPLLTFPLYSKLIQAESKYYLAITPFQIGLH